MNLSFEIRNDSSIKESEVLKVLQDLDDFYVPPISSQVDLKKYAKKITRNAEIILVKIDEDIIGISALYCNNFKTLTAFITTIGISEKYQGYGLGHELLEKSIKLAWSQGMKKIKLEVNKENKAAVNFYKKNNFSLIEKRSESVDSKDVTSWYIMERVIG